MSDARPPRPETLPRQVPLEDLWDLQDAIGEAFPDKRVSAAAFEALAVAQNKPLAFVYAAAASEPAWIWTDEAAVSVRICVGACQSRGGLALMDGALLLRDAALDAGKAGFRAVPVGCMGVCERGPALSIRSADGAEAVHAPIHLAALPDLLDGLP